MKDIASFGAAEHEVKDMKEWKQANAPHKAHTQGPHNKKKLHINNSHIILLSLWREIYLHG